MGEVSEVDPKYENDWRVLVSALEFGSEAAIVIAVVT